MLVRVREDCVGVVELGVVSRIRVRRGAAQGAAVSARGRVYALATSVLAACATTTPDGLRPTARPVPRPGSLDAQDSELEMAAPEPPEPPKPLGPLREFTKKEWRRIKSVQRFVRRAARDQELSASLINGMIWVESKFERRARGRRGPRGLLQLMPRTGRAMARRLRRKYMPYSADFSIQAGTEYLTVMLEQFNDDLHLALAAYNVGPAVVTQWQDDGATWPKPRWPYVAHVDQAARAFCERLKMPRFEPEQGPFVCGSPPIEPLPEPEPEPEPLPEPEPELAPEPALLGPDDAVSASPRPESTRET